MWGAAKIVSSDDDGRVLTRFGRSDDFVVGVDNTFVRLWSTLGIRGRRGVPTVADVDTNTLINLDILGTTHLVDCSADDPSAYRFVQYGNRISTHDGREYAGRRLRDAEWPLVRMLAERDYAYAKANRSSTLAQVELSWQGREIVYRRYIIPLAGERGDISHLLIATRPNLLNVVPSSFD